MNSSNVFKNALIPLVFFIVSFICFSIPVFLNEGRLFSTDQEVFIRAAENLRTRFSWVQLSPLNEKYQTSIIDSRENPYVSKHQGLISQYPPGQAIILALLKTFIPNYNLVECFIGALGIAVFYLLVKRLLGKREALFCATILMFTPIYYFWSMFALADVTTFVVILLTILVYLKARETNKISFYMLSSLLLGATVWLKYPNIILIAPFFSHYLITRKKREQLHPAFIGFFVFSICIIALLLYHKWAFGGFFTTGYGYNELKLSESVKSGVNVITLLSRLLNISIIKRLFIKVTNGPIHIAVCSPLTLVGIFGCFSLERKDWKEFSLLFFIAFTVLIFYAIFAINIVGEETYHRSTISSYHRYILPTYCLLMIPAVLFSRQLSTKKLWMVLAVITAMNLSSLVLSTINPSNLHWLLAAQKETSQLRQKHLKLTSEESIIIGQPVVFYMVNANRHLIHCREDRHLQSAIFRNELTRVIHALLKDGHEVYVIQDYEEELKIENIALELIDAETSLYKLKRKQE